VVNSKQVFPETLMPAFYRVDGLNRVTDDFAGKTILTPQEVEDVVAYLKSLDEPQRSETAAKDAKPTTSLAATYAIVDGPHVKAIDASLTGKPGDAANGEKLVVANKKGNCFACHEIAALQHKAAGNPQGYSDMGQIAPRLDGVATRYTEGELRMLVADSKQVFPQSLMPGFLVKDGLNRVNDDFAGKTILEPQEVEDVVAFLKQLSVDTYAGMGGMSGMRDAR
jgi:sulfur-oxidizing protein SoxX